MPRILDAALRLYMNRFGPIFSLSLGSGIVAWLLLQTGPRVPLPAVPHVAVSWFLPFPSSIVRPTLWATLLSSAVQLLATVCIILIADQAAARPDDPPAPLPTVVGAGLRRLWPFVVTLFASSIASVVAGVALVVPGVFLFTRWSTAQVAVVVEGSRASRALGRSYALTRGLFWHALGAGLLGLLAVAVFGVVLRLPALIPASGPLADRLRSLWSTAALAATTPYASCVLVLLFHDLRARKEGADLVYGGET